MADSLKEAVGWSMADEDAKAEQFGYRATMVMDGYIYQRERIADHCSWWRCRLNRRRSTEGRRCMNRAIYKDGRLTMKVEHSHGPETNNPNYVPPIIRRGQLRRGKLKGTQPSPTNRTLLAQDPGCRVKQDTGSVVSGFVQSTDQDLLLSEDRGVAKQHHCSQCDLRFVLARVLETHMMLEHGVSADWKCVHCGMQFLQKTSLHLHLDFSHPALHTAAAPPLSTGSLAEMELQEPGPNVKQEPAAEATPIKKKRLRVTEKPVYKCQFCTAEFPHLCKLTVHMRKHTGEKPYKCPMCPKMFSTGSKRSSHFKSSHLKVRKHLCTWCGKKFTNLNTLKQHIRTHTGEKPYSCSVCSRLFTKRNAMKVHMRQHTGEKPYVCDQCGQSFTVKVSLRTHLKSKHNIIVDTSMFRREGNPGDSTLPTIGRPKRKEAEKQLFVNVQNGTSEAGSSLVPVNSATSDADMSVFLDNYSVYNPMAVPYPAAPVPTYPYFHGLHNA